MEAAYLTLLDWILLIGVGGLAIYINVIRKT